MTRVSMVLIERLLALRRRKNREEVAGRAAEVIAHVLFDVGVDRFMNGSMLLDRQFRLRFYAVLPLGADERLAAIALRDLPEAQAMRACMADVAFDAVVVAHHTQDLTDGLMRELLACSAELRALPALRVDHVFALR
ncbi:hypothetical protein AB2N08_14335 [Massilia aurea]|uniref:hypothetical protein n=1 Tax=Massilia aurea TaxID=373040 RepID=UPI00346352EE